MKKSELIFGAALVPIDFVAIMWAAVVAYIIRFSESAQAVRPVVFGPELPFVHYLQLAGIVSLVTLIVFATHGLYAMRSTRRPVEEFTRIFSGISIGAMLIIIYMFLSAELFQSRFILLTAYVIAIIFVALGRYLVRRFQLEMFRRGQGTHRAALVGNGRYAEQLTAIVKKRVELGFTIVADIPDFNIEELQRAHKEHALDVVIQTDPTSSEKHNLALLDFCEEHKIDFKYIPNLFETHAANVQYRAIGGVPVVELLKTPLDGWGRVAKRAMDIFGAIVGLIIFSPLLLATALFIKMDSPGPVFYTQTRIGRSREKFSIIKFRSMYNKYSIGKKYGGDSAQEFENNLRQKNNERQGPLFKMREDPRITKVGRFIRRWRIDELPQFFNVLQGEMSLLGPRPHLPKEVDCYDKHHEMLFTIKPGMSGMAQVSGNAGLSFDQEANLDIAYIETWSLKLDTILLMKTFVLLATDRNAV